MRAFLFSLALLVGIAGIAAVVLDNLHMSSRDVFSSADTRHEVGQ